MNKNKNISIEDYNKMVGDEERVQFAIIEANKVLFAANTAPLKDYNMRYLKWDIVAYDISDAEEADDILITISEYKNDITHLPKHIEGAESITTTADTNSFEECELEVFSVEYLYHIPYADDSRELRVIIEQQVKNKIESALQPSSCNRPRSISCGALDKFKAGKIDWLTMQDIVYGDCKLGE